VLANCSDIFESAVIGQPDAKWGEVAVAVLIVRPGSLLTTTNVMACLDGKLARYKHPRQIVLAYSPHKTTTGKVQKAQLAAQISRQIA
jgi:fatty-acyl-CoA synthase